MIKFIFGIEVFLFIFSILIVLKTLYSVVKIWRLKEGKIDVTFIGNVILGSAISYIITMLIIGF